MCVYVVCVWVCGVCVCGLCVCGLCVCVCLCVCSPRHPPFNAHVPYLSSVASRSLPNFSPFSHKRHDFRKKKVLNT